MRAEPGCGELLDTQVDDWGMQSAVGRAGPEQSIRGPFTPLRLNYSLASRQNRMSTSIKGPLAGSQSRVHAHAGVHPETTQKAER